MTPDKFIAEEKRGVKAIDRCVQPRGKKQVEHRAKEDHISHGNDGLIGSGHTSLASDAQQVPRFQKGRASAGPAGKPEAQLPYAGLRTERILQIRDGQFDRLGSMKQKEVTENGQPISARGQAQVDRREKNPNLRFYAEPGQEQRVGRRQKPEGMRQQPQKNICETHRYYLAAEGRADKMQGKARSSSLQNRPQVASPAPNSVDMPQKGAPSPFATFAPPSRSQQSPSSVAHGRSSLSGKPPPSCSDAGRSSRCMTAKSGCNSDTHSVNSSWSYSQHFGPHIAAQRSSKAESEFSVGTQSSLASRSQRSGRGTDAQNVSKHSKASARSQSTASSWTSRTSQRAPRPSPES